MNLKVNSRPVLREKKKKKTKEEEEEEKCSQRGKRISFLFFLKKKAFKEPQNNIKILLPQFYPSPNKGELVIFHCKV